MIIYNRLVIKAHQSKFTGRAEIDIKSISQDETSK